MIALTSAIEPLRHANQMSGTRYYQWGVYSETGYGISASNGLNVGVEGTLADIHPNATVVLCGGPNIEQHTTSRLIAWLRKTARHGRDIGALCTGTHALAKAGLLSHRRCTIHWENAESFTENFPDLEMTGQLYEIDRDRFTCAGETASIDLMVTMISVQHDKQLASTVADQVLHSPVREAKQSQRPSRNTRIGVRNSKLSKAIERMEECIEEPATPLELAECSGLSRRQLERLFEKHLGVSLQRYYRSLRLQKARTYLLQTDMSVMDVAVACGFSSASHFSKCYRNEFQNSPYVDRGLPARL